ncbi:RNA polymerase sigma factor [Spirochaetia bacterium 38H-sp]|uniref:RNA polymerase sigma factor n=1 Tax=Rarispira pelagica TaxID=3141764 RepID=A0ABU9UFB1_9SPIR
MDNIIKAAKNGDKKAFSMIVEKYKDDVAKTIAGITGKTGDIEDIGQDVFIKLYKNIKNFKGDSSIKTYIIRIAINESLNYKKKKAKRQESHLIEEISAAEEKNNVLEKQIINTVMKRLNKKHRTLLTLFYINDMPVKEIAMTLNIPEGTVLSGLSRARKKFKEIYRTLEEESDE